MGTFYTPGMHRLIKLSKKQHGPTNKDSQPLGQSTKSTWTHKDSADPQSNIYLNWTPSPTWLSGSLTDIVS